MLFNIEQENLKTRHFLTDLVRISNNWIKHICQIPDLCE